VRMWPAKTGYLQRLDPKEQMPIGPSLTSA
jgi:hypothetical protein